MEQPMPIKKILSSQKKKSREENPRVSWEPKKRLGLKVKIINQDEKIYIVNKYKKGEANKISPIKTFIYSSQTWKENKKKINILLWKKGKKLYNIHQLDTEL